MTDTPGRVQGEDGGEFEALARYRAAARRRLAQPPVQRERGLGERRRRLLRTVQGTPTGPGPDARDPQRAMDVWLELAARRGWTNEMALWQLVHRWSHIVGPQVSQHISVVAFDPVPRPTGQVVPPTPSRAPSQHSFLPGTMTPTDRPEPRTGGKLTLQADTNSWQQQMIWNLPHLQRRLDEDLGRGVVAAIVVLGPVQRGRRYGPRRV